MSATDRTAVAAVLAEVLADLRPGPPVSRDLRDAAGLVCVNDVLAPTPLPPEDRAAMDGVAVRSGDLATASPASPLRLQLDGATLAGRPDQRPLPPVGAREIATGAPLPPGADAIVRVEDLHRTGDVVTVTSAVAAGRDVRPAGEDAARGDPLVLAGRVLDTGAVGGLAGAGVRTVEVVPPPRVAVVPTGDEVVAGTTPDAVGPALAHLLGRDGAEVTVVDPVPDELPLLVAAVHDLAARYDVVITVGGVSVGVRDHAGSLVAALAVGHHVSLAMRPGRPFAWGRTDTGTTVLCLPGTPIAALAATVLIVRPVVARLAGRTPPQTAVMRLGAPVEGHPRFRSLVPARVQDALARPVVGRGAADLARLAGTSSMIDLPAGTERLDAGETVDVWLLP